MKSLSTRLRELSDALGTLAPEELTEAISAISWGDLLEWLNEECCAVMPIAVPTGGGDHDVLWEVVRYQMAKPCEVVIGRGRSAMEAIYDARKPAGDPTRFDHVPESQLSEEPKP